MNDQTPDTGIWLKPLGDVFLGLDTSAVIRRVMGVLEIAPGLPESQLTGVSWRDFVTHYADPSVQEGLNYAWQAIAKERVARAYWPRYLPFKPGVIARMRPVAGDPAVSFVIHLSPVTEYNLADLISEPLLGIMDHMIATSLQIFSGVGGPLTDRQVKDIGHIVNHAEHAQQLLDDLRAEIMVPATMPPMPYPIIELFAFATRDFLQRRITTHRLSIQSDLSGEMVYCQPVVRETVHHIIETLIGSVAAESAIALSDTVDEDAQAVQITVQYQSHESAMQVKTQIDPLDLADPKRLGGMRSIQRLVTAAHSRLKPVNGRAWAEPCVDNDPMARIVLVLPRWKAAI